MSEQWNSNSLIEEKKTSMRTPPILQLKVHFSISSIYDIIRKYQNIGKINENDYRNLILFIESEHSDKHKELSDYVKELFGEKLKEEYFKYMFNMNKNKLPDNTYNVVYNYLINGSIDESMNIFKDDLYQVLVKLPELFNSDMIPKVYKEKIAQILSIVEIKKQDLHASKLNEDGIQISDFLYQKKLTNEELKNKILKDMPPNYSNLEKSIYIYIKLCQILSYDSNYYANKNLYRYMHQEFENVSKIGAQTYNAVCYEFVTIYSEMLKDMGVKVSSATKLDMDVDDNDKIVFTNFNDAHSNLKYTIGDIIIFADSTLSVLNGDMINVKMNKQLNGLQCLNANPEAKQKFASALQKVYSNMQYENSNFKKYNDDIKNKPLVEKLKILFDDIYNADFNSTDFISYITSIKHELFTDDELYWNLRISYVGKNINGNQYPVVIFSVNTNDIKNVQQDTVQYLYDAYEKSLLKIDKEEIEEMFKNGDLFFIDGNINIPNINLSHNNSTKK